MAKMSFGSKWGRVEAKTKKDASSSTRSAEEVVREIKKQNQPLPGEDYREQSLQIHGLICARCGREFEEKNRRLLTVHHKDGNHHNNPRDGSNWENLCVYCHENEHSRELLGEYFSAGTNHQERETSVVYSGAEQSQHGNAELGSLGLKLKQALEKKKA
jgi:hypothetical protein